MEIADGSRKGFPWTLAPTAPEVDFLTMAFQNHGWRGIHIEPVEVFIRRQHGAWRDGYTMTQIGVEVDTLARISAARIRDDGQFLKINVEGDPPGVIEGLDLALVPPGIPVVDATDLTPQVPYLADWEKLTTSRDDDVVCYDGSTGHLRRPIPPRSPASAGRMYSTTSQLAIGTARQQMRSVELAHTEVKQGVAMQVTRTCFADQRAHDSEYRLGELRQLGGAGRGSGTVAGR